MDIFYFACRLVFFFHSYEAEFVQSLSKADENFTYRYIDDVFL